MGRRKNVLGGTLLAIVLLGGFAVAACAQILGVEPLQNAPDAGADVAPPVDAGPEACVFVHPPTAPDGGDDDGGLSGLLALRTAVLGLEKASTVDIGWDLDDHCTCADTVRPESCVRATGAGPETCDKSGGRDLTGNATILQANFVYNGISDTNLQKQLDLGKFGQLVAIRNYNGLPDDPKVRIDLAPSYGTILTNDAGVPILNGSGFLQNAPLKHDGADRWGYVPPYASKTVDGLIDGVARDDNAYVKGGVAVAHFPVAYVTVQFDVGNSNPLVFRIVDVVVAAKVNVGDGGAITLSEGRLGGRVRIQDMMDSFLVWEDPIDGPSVCPGKGLYEIIRTGICKNRDVRGARAEDGKNLPCDAISFALGFAAEPGLVYGSVGYVYKPTQCWDGGLPTGPANGNPCP